MYFHNLKVVRVFMWTYANFCELHDFWAYHLCEQPCGYSQFVTVPNVDHGAMCRLVMFLCTSWHSLSSRIHFYDISFHTLKFEFVCSMSHLIADTQETSGPSGMAESSLVINTYSGAEFHMPVAVSGPV